MIRLAVRVPRERAEVVLAELLDLAPAGVEETELGDSLVEYAVYGPPGELPALPDLEALAGGQTVEISTSEVADDWQERWRDFHRPVLIEPPRTAPRTIPALRVRPPWEPAARDVDADDSASAVADAIELVIDPGQAFGTGGHASTRLCLTLLLELCGCEPRPTAALDVGTGSGVLAIAAGRLGLAPLLGLDNEQESVDAAAENAAVNGVALTTACFDLRREPLPWLGRAREAGDPEPQATLLLANLLRPLLLDLSGALVHAPAALIASGLLVAELDEISGEFAGRHGLAERARRTDGEWGALLLTAQPVG